jgi:hypothetical protein
MKNEIYIKKKIYPAKGLNHLADMLKNVIMVT